MAKSIWFGCVLAVAGAGWMHDAHADDVRWPSPWKPGVELVYEIEQFENETHGGEPHEIRRSTDRETIRIVEALADGGFVQQWTWTGSKNELIHGDPDEFELYKQIAAVFADLPLEVELDADSHASRLRNLDQVLERAETGAKPVIVSGIVHQAAKSLPEGLDEAHRTMLLDEIRAEVESVGDVVFATLFSPERSARMFIEEAQRYNEFTGLSMAVGETRTVPSTLGHPLGQEPIPATLELTLSRHDGAPGVHVLSWTRKPDPSQARAVAAMLAERHGNDVPEDAQLVSPADASFTSSGLVLFRQETGVIELFELQVESAYGPVRNIDRRRKRLVGSAVEWDELRAR